MDCYTLDNGIRLVHKRVKSTVANCGLIINSGSRDEQKGELGIAHFIEHVLFKGTKKRKAFHILSRLDDVGGELDAFTTKEDTTIIATILNEFFERATELITDIVFNSTFPIKELEKEKEVIYEEINLYKDSPSELIFDDFENQIFNNHPLGRDILGSKLSIKKFNKDRIVSFINRTYNTDQMIFSCICDIEFEKVKKIFIKYFSHIKPNKRSFKREGFSDFIPVNKLIKKRTHQAHCIIGSEAYNSFHKNKTALILLNNILAGPGLNSRLNLLLREKHGLVYNVESQFVRYSDSGIWNIYFGSDKNNLEKIIDLVHKELRVLTKVKIGPVQLSKAKKQIIGQIAISLENYPSLVYSLGKSYLLYNGINSIEKISKEINEITSEKLLEVANQIFAKDKLSTLIYN